MNKQEIKVKKWLIYKLDTAKDFKEKQKYHNKISNFSRHMIEYSRR